MIAKRKLKCCSLNGIFQSRQMELLHFDFPLSIVFSITVSSVLFGRGTGWTKRFVAVLMSSRFMFSFAVVLISFHSCCLVALMNKNAPFVFEWLMEMPGVLHTLILPLSVNSMRCDSSGLV